MNNQTFLISKENKNITDNVFIASELDGETLIVRNIELHKNCIDIETIDFGEVGFERKSDWNRLSNKLNKYNHTQLLNRLTCGKKSHNNGNLIITILDSIYGTVQIDFKEPIDVIVGEIGDSYIVTKCSSLKGTISWEWWYTNRNILGYADSLQVILSDIELLS